MEGRPPTNALPLVFTRLLDELHSVMVAVVAGARYGTKIRLPHALVMTFLFKRDMSTEDKLKAVIRLVAEHASNLASFAAIYKTLIVCLKWTSRHMGPSTPNTGLLRKLGRVILSTIVHGPFPGEDSLLRATTRAPPGHPERSHHALIAGAVGGYLVWGRYSSVNYQIVLYLTSRVLVGLWKRFLARPGNKVSLLARSANRTYPFAAAAVWGVVMMLFEESPDVLHPSLKSSMDEIYRYGLPRRKEQG